MSRFLFSAGGRGVPEDCSVCFGGLLIDAGSTPRAREPGGSRHPRSTTAQLSAAEHFQGSVVYD